MTDCRYNLMRFFCCRYADKDNTDKNKINVKYYINVNETLYIYI